MEEHQPRELSPQSYQISYNLAHQPYSDSEPDDVPLEEDVNVVPMPKSRTVPSSSGAIDHIDQIPLSPRPSNKRKQSTSHRGRSNPGKQKTATPYRSPQVAKQPFADELQHLEELAERINCILAERAQQRAYLEPPQPAASIPEARPSVSSPNSPSSPPPGYGYIPLETADTESLKQQAKRIRQRLSQLELMMDNEQPMPPRQSEPGHHPVEYARSPSGYFHIHRSPLSTVPTPIS